MTPPRPEPARLFNGAAGMTPFSNDLVYIILATVVAAVLIWGLYWYMG